LKINYKQVKVKVGDETVIGWVNLGEPEQKQKRVRVLDKANESEVFIAVRLQDPYVKDSSKETKIINKRQILYIDDEE